MREFPDATTSAIAGLFNGFAPNALFKLTDGTFWVQCDTRYDRHDAENPAVELLALDDGHFMKVDGMDNMVLVQQVEGVIESQVFGRFNGWTGKTVVKLTNGQMWQQAQFIRKYAVKYMPPVLIYLTPSGPVMQVAGTRVKVRQIRQG